MIGPIIKDQLYFVTRHSLPTVNGINPFASLAPKFWLNYLILSLISILISMLIHLKMFKTISLKEVIEIIISPSESHWSGLSKAGNMLPCLIAFTFWTFSILYGVDLASALVGMHH